MKHLLKLGDYSEKEILSILNLADQLKYEKKHNIEHHYLKGKTLAVSSTGSPLPSCVFAFERKSAEPPRSYMPTSKETLVLVDDFAKIMPRVLPLR